MMAKPIAHDVAILINSFLSGFEHFFKNYIDSVINSIKFYLYSSMKFAIYIKKRK